MKIEVGKVYLAKLENQTEELENDGNSLYTALELTKVLIVKRVNFQEQPLYLGTLIYKDGMSEDEIFSNCHCFWFQEDGDYGWTEDNDRYFKIVGLAIETVTD